MNRALKDNIRGVAQMLSILQVSFVKSRFPGLRSFIFNTALTYMSEHDKIVKVTNIAKETQLFLLQKDITTIFQVASKLVYIKMEKYIQLVGFHLLLMK